MSNDAGSSGWRELVGRYDRQAHDKMVAYIGHVVGDDTLPPKYRELVLLATSTAIRFRPSMLTHGGRAIEEGASREELFQTIALTSLTAGFTCMIEGMQVLSELGVGDDD
jgi:alkylhydroperoxidase/carboxymuconolactone decarboxylase family protein YurZ